MIKIYPLLIDTIIPAFNYEIVIPYKLNRGNNASDLQGRDIEVVIKSSMDRVLTPKIVVPYSGEFFVKVPLTYYFEEEKKDLKSYLREGEFYKFQIRVKPVPEEREETVFSTVAIGRYVSAATITIEEFENNTEEGIPASLHTYIGKVAFAEGALGFERPEQYKFTIYDEKMKVVQTTEWQYHKTDLDETPIFRDRFITDIELDQNQIYYVDYQVKTQNLLSLSSIKYAVVSSNFYDMDLKLNIEVIHNDDQGYNKVIITNKNNKDVFYGDYRITRYNPDTRVWEKFFDIFIDGKTNLNIVKKDCAIEQGISYQYAVQKINKHGILTKKQTAESVINNYEDMFLVDKNRQLRIRFSPDISSMKTVIQESKTETIGSKYPYFTRNSKIEYMEFPISGKISYLEDDEELFMSYDKLNLSLDSENPDKLPTTNLTATNVKRERDFKLEVLKWLNNGEPKLLKTNQEGIYLVRLMNISLSPEKTLGRMIHNFSATAYEMAEVNYANLVKYNIIDTQSFVVTAEEASYQGIWKTYIAGQDTPPSEYDFSASPVNAFKVTGAMPGDWVQLTFFDNTTQTIYIGVSGSFNSGVIDSVKYINFSLTTGSIDVQYKFIIENTEFDKVIKYITNTQMATVLPQELKPNKQGILSLKSTLEGDSVYLKKVVFSLEEPFNSDIEAKIKIVIDQDTAYEVDINASEHFELSEADFTDLGNADIIYPNNNLGVRTDVLYVKGKVTKE